MLIVWCNYKKYIRERIFKKTCVVKVRITYLRGKMPLNYPQTTHDF